MSKTLRLPEKAIQEIEKLETLEKEKKYDQIIEPLKKLFLFYCKHQEQASARNSLQRLLNAICQTSFDSALYSSFTEFIIFDCMESNGKYHEIIISTFKDYKNLILYTLEQASIHLSLQFFNSRLKYSDNLRYRIDVKNKDVIMEKFDKDRAQILSQILDWILKLEEYNHPPENIPFYGDLALLLKLKLGISTRFYNNSSWMNVFLRLSSTDWTSIYDVIGDDHFTVERCIELLSSWSYSSPTLPWKTISSMFQESCIKMKEFINNPLTDITCPITTQLTESSNLAQRIKLLNNTLALEELKKLCEELLSVLNHDDFPRLTLYLEKKLSMIEWERFHHPLSCISTMEKLHHKYKSDWDIGYSLIQLYVIQFSAKRSDSYSVKALDLIQSMLVIVQREKINRLNIISSWIYYMRKEYKLAFSISENCKPEFWIDWYQCAIISWAYYIDSLQSIITLDEINLPKHEISCRKILSFFISALQSNVETNDSIIYNSTIADKSVVLEGLGHFYLGLYYKTDNEYYKQKATQCYRKCPMKLPLSIYFLSKIVDSFEFDKIDPVIQSEYHIIKIFYFIPWNESMSLLLMGQGQLSLKKSNYIDAISYLQSSLKQNSLNSMSWYWLACSYYENGQYTPSYKAFQQFEKYHIENDILRTNVFIYKIQLLNHLGKIDQAQNILRLNEFEEEISLFLHGLLKTSPERCISLSNDQYILSYHLALSIPEHVSLECRHATDQTSWIWDICGSLPECLPWLQCLEGFLVSRFNHSYKKLFVSMILYRLGVKNLRDTDDDESTLKLLRASIIACSMNFYTWNVLGILFERNEHLSLGKYCFMEAIDVAEQVLISSSGDKNKERLKEQFLAPVWCNLSILYQESHISRVQYCIDKSKSLNPLWPVVWIIEATRLEDDDTKSDDILAYCGQGYQLIQNMYPNLRNSSCFDSLFILYAHWSLYSKYVQSRTIAVNFEPNSLSFNSLYITLWYELMQNNGKLDLSIFKNKLDDIISLHCVRLEIEQNLNITGSLKEPPRDTRLITLFYLVSAWKFLFYEKDFDECLKNLEKIHFSDSSLYHILEYEMVCKVLYQAGGQHAKTAMQKLSTSVHPSALLMTLMANCIQNNRVTELLHFYIRKRLTRTSPFCDPKLDIEPLMHIYSFLYSSSSIKFKTYLCRWFLLFPSTFEFKPFFCE